MPRVCKGLSEDQPCVFGPDGKPSQPKPGNSKCSWCDPELLNHVLASEQGRRRLRQLFDKMTAAARTAARNRLPKKVLWSFPEATPNAGPRPARKRPAASPSSAAGPHKRPAAAVAALGCLAPVAQFVARPVMRRRLRKSPPVAGEAPAPVPAPEAPPPAPAEADRTWQLNLADMPSLNAAEAALEAHAAAVAPLLQKHWIAGDGNCLYRSVALQTEQGQEHHKELRQQSVAKTLAEWYLYAGLFAGEDPEAAVASWARRMAQDRFWGDEIACRSLADFLRRPLIIWRPSSPDQLPSCFVPPDYAGQGWTKPIYLELNEAVVGSEHYSALVPAAAAPAQPKEEMPAKTPAQKRGLEGWEAIGDWGKYGLTREEYRLLLDTIAELTPQEAMDELSVLIPNFEHTKITVQLLKHLREADRRAAAENAFEQQKKVLEQIQQGVLKQDALQAVCPGVGVRFLAAARGQRCKETEEYWHQEFAQRFSVLKQAPSTRTWSESPEGDNALAAKAQAWMRTPSWTFCAKCGRKEIQPNMHWKWLNNPGRCVARKCPGGCDLNPLELERVLDQPRQSKRLKAYVTPHQDQWQAWVQHIAPEAPPGTLLHQVLSKEEREALALVKFEVSYQTCRGGKATITSKQKKTIIRARWKAVRAEQALSTEAGRRAFEWLVTNNATYRDFVQKHNRFLEERAAADTALWLPTAQLLLQMPGLEVAARPWLYPFSACGDTDLASRLKELNQIRASSTPSLKTSWFRKVCSRSCDYWEDYALQCFLYDVSLARTLTSVVSLAKDKKMAPETFATDMAAFEMYWHRQTQLLEDVCRQAARLPELFFTLAPAEWKFPLHEGVLFAERDEDLSSLQLLLTLHLYNSLQAVLRRLLFENGDALKQCGIQKVDHWCMRFEFQKRGTIHVHVICWYQPLPGRHPAELSGRSGEQSSSPLLQLLEQLFRCSVDVQGGSCRHNLLTYVLGYVAKASESGPLL